MTPDTPLIAGIDAGTSRVRALVFDPAGRVHAQGSSPTPTTTPRPGWAEHDAHALWKACVAALASATAQLDDSRPIVGVAVASVGEAGVLIDAAGEPIAPLIAWYDARAQAQAQWLETHLGIDRVFDATGLRIDRMFGLSKLLWLAEQQPDAYRRAQRWLHVADYLAFRLGAAPATDYSLASRTMALDLRAAQWARALVTEAGINSQLLPPLVASGTRIGEVSAEVAAATGLPAGCAIGAGGHDHVIGALAAGAWRAGTLLDSMGTAEALLLSLQAPVFDARLVDQGYSQGAMRVAGDSELAGYYAVGAMTTSGACVEWFRETIAGGESHAALVTSADRVPAGSRGARFFPQMRIGAPPNPNPSASGAFLGLTPDVTRADMYRALLEGLAFDARLTAQGLLDVTGTAWPAAVLAIGGNTQNTLLTAIKASVFARPLRVIDMPEATSLGAALLGGLAAGLYSSIDEALAGVVAARHDVTPRDDCAALYETLFETVYRGLPRHLARIGVRRE